MAKRLREQSSIQAVKGKRLSNFLLDKVKLLWDGTRESSKQKGEHTIFTIPPKLAYGEFDSAAIISPNVAPQFAVKLLSWVSAKDKLRSSGTVFAAGSNNFAIVFMKRGNKGVNKDCCIVWKAFRCQPNMIFCGIFDEHGLWGYFVVKTARKWMPSSLMCNWQRTLAQSSLDLDFDIDNDKKLYWFAIWKHSYLKICAAVDPELKQRQKIDSFNSGTTVLLNFRQSRTSSSQPSSCNEGDPANVVANGHGVDMRRGSLEELKGPPNKTGPDLDCQTIMLPIRNEPYVATGPPKLVSSMIYLVFLTEFVIILIQSIYGLSGGCGPSNRYVLVSNGINDMQFPTCIHNKENVRATSSDLEVFPSSQPRMFYSSLLLSLSGATLPTTMLNKAGNTFPETIILLQIPLMPKQQEGLWLFLNRAMDNLQSVVRKWLGRCLAHLCSKDTAGGIQAILQQQHFTLV